MRLKKLALSSPVRIGATGVAAVANHQQQHNHGGGGVNGNNNGPSRNSGPTMTNLHQLLYPSNEEYVTTNSSSGNPHVSSSQQGNEFNEDSR